MFFFGVVILLLFCDRRRRRRRRRLCLHRKKVKVKGKVIPLQARRDTEGHTGHGRVELYL